MSTSPITYELGGRQYLLTSSGTVDVCLGLAADICNSDCRFIHERNRNPSGSLHSDESTRAMKSSPQPTNAQGGPFKPLWLEWASTLIVYFLLRSTRAMKGSLHAHHRSGAPFKPLA